MRRLRLFFFAAALICLGQVSCSNNDDSAVYRELLIEALWYRDIPAPATIEAYYYNFRDDGTVSVYPVLSGTPQEGTDYLYIYDAELETIAIESFGMYEIEEINTDRVVLKNISGKTVLERIRESVALPGSSPKAKQ